MEDEVKPDGYDVFEDLERFFQKQKVNIGNAANQNAPVTAAYSKRLNSTKSGKLKL